MATKHKKVKIDAVPTYNGKPINQLSQEEFDNGYMADLPVAFADEELSQRLDVAIESVKNGNIISINEVDELDSLLGHLFDKS